MSDMFSTQKNGYNKEEVESYIKLLKKDYEERLAQQKQRIFSLKNELDTTTKSGVVDELTNLVERTRQMERSTQSIYELESRKLKIICNRLNDYISSIEELMPANAKEGVKKQLSKIRETIESSFSNTPVVDSVDPVKRLLAKMVDNAKDDNNYSNYEVNKDEHSSDNKTKSTTVSSPKSEVKKAKKERQPVGLFNEFLNDNVAENQFEKIMFGGKKTPSNYVTSNLSYPTPNESGFDLKAAVNPKDDLDEIMKAFDFFDADDDNN